MGGRFAARASFNRHVAPNGGASTVWLTPKHVIDALGPFDLDPCAATPPRPFDCAVRGIVEAEDGLTATWDGLVWLNPPYGPAAADWLRRLAAHPPGGIALVFARTDTPWMQTAIAASSGQLWLKGRLFFLYPDGRRATHNGGAPSVLLAFGEVARERLWGSALPGLRTRAIGTFSETSSSSVIGGTRRL